MSFCHKGEKNAIFKVINDGNKITLNSIFFNQNIISLMERKVRKIPCLNSQNRIFNPSTESDSSRQAVSASSSTQK